MAIRPDEITSVLKAQLEQYKSELNVTNVGSVLQVGDGIARVYGMEKAMSMELVEFDDEPTRLFDRYFGLKESLEALYGRPVDLVSAGSLRNPFFIAAVNETRQLMYAQEDAKAA